MQSVIKFISILLALIMSYFIVGNPEGFQPYVVETVTTQTTQITIIGENKTRNKIGDPRVERIEKMVEKEWTLVGEPTDIDSDYSTYNPLSTYKHILCFEELSTGNKTLTEGEYRIVISYTLMTPKGNVEHIAYSCFTVFEV